MAATQLQKSLKGLLDQAEAILTAAGDKPLTIEQSTQYTDLVNQAKSVKTAIEAQDQADAIKSWSQESAGSAVVAGFSGQALPGEGEIKGVTADPKEGELYAIDGIGQQKLAALKSGAYKDAFNSYVRRMGTQGSLSGMKGDAMKVLNEGVDTAGGFWLPPDFRAELVKKMPTITSIRANAQVYTTGSDAITFPGVTYTTDDKYTSGARFSWQASSPLAADVTESTNPVSGQIKIPVHSAVLAIFLTREQLEDNSFDVLGYITEIATEAYALGEEDAFTGGDGVGKPYGFTVDATLKAAAVLSGVADKISWQGTSGSEDPTTGILGMEAALPPQYENGAKWFANKKTYAAIRGLVDGNKRPLWQQTDGAFQSWVNGYPATLLGYPIAKNQFMDDIGDGKYPYCLGNMKGYYIADRVGLSVEVLREVRALRGEVVVYCRKRVGGQLVKNWMLKLGKSDNA